ncbi:MAG: M48 family metallopeptidase [Saprospiraceae bacterium]|nr:M48 family metallopeptidase [Saprospiraceae bacterium]
MAKPEDIWIRDYRIPVKVRRHWQPTIRFSITSKHAQVILPKYFKSEAITQQVQRLRSWVKQKASEQPKILERFKQKTYEPGQFFIVRGERYTLDIQAKERKTIAAKIHQKSIQLFLPKGQAQEQLIDKIAAVISRAFAQLYLKEIESRVREINALYFKEDINKVKLKYTKSNWGSCSSKKNINLSTRLLMAPESILDYVIVHELAHLKEMNHSKKFWTIVESIMPDYKEKEAWLKTNGYKLSY